MRHFWVAFVTLFFAELGDKTQLSVISLTAKTKAPLWVFLGAVSALAIVTLLGVLFGEAALRVVPERVLRKIAALLFIGIGLLMLFNKI